MSLLWEKSQFTRTACCVRTEARMASSTATLCTASPPGWAAPTPSGADIAPYHDRQIVILPAGAGVHWLKLSAAEDLILQPSPAGALGVARLKVREITKGCWLGE